METTQADLTGGMISSTKMQLYPCPLSVQSDTCSRFESKTKIRVVLFDFVSFYSKCPFQVPIAVVQPFATKSKKASSGLYHFAYTADTLVCPLPVVPIVLLWNGADTWLPMKVILFAASF
jgi:hypothetical protein